MKTLPLLTCLCFLLLPSFLLAQTTTKEKIAKQICFTWKADSIAVDGVKSIPPNGQADNTITFKNDYTLISVTEGVEDEPATWRYDEQQNEIIISNAEVGELFRLAIIEISDNKMVGQLKAPLMQGKTIVYTSKVTTK